MNSDVDTFNAAIDSLSGYICKDTSENAATVIMDSLQILYANRDKALEQKKTASDGGTSEAAGENNNTSTLSDNSENLSSFHIGQKVHTPHGDGIIYAAYPKGRPSPFYDVGFQNRSTGNYLESDLTPL